MGMRQSLGLFAPDLARDLALTMADFRLAIAIQRLAWGVQAYAGALVVRHGYRPLPLGGATLYFLGLVFLSTAQGKIGLILGGGLIYDLLGSYTHAWQVGVSIGLAAGIVQLGFALWWPPSRPLGPRLQPQG
jgi:hypothetical protein